MPQKPKDARETGLKAADISAWLKENPEFLSRHPELLGDLVAPGRDLGGGVADEFALALARQFQIGAQFFDHHLLQIGDAASQIAARRDEIAEQLGMP